MNAFRSYLVFALAALVSSACSDPLGRVPAERARTAAALDGIASAFQYRFTDVSRDASFGTARRGLIANSLMPARIFADSTFWTGRPSSTSRIMIAHGSLGQAGYQFSLAPSAAAAASHPSLRNVGDSRHVMTLTRLRGSEFRWETSVELAIGNARPDDLVSAVSAILAGPEGLTASDVRRAGPTLFPGAVRSLSGAIAIDSLAVMPGAARSTFVHLQLRIQPTRLRPAYPAFAEYIEKYATRSTCRLVLRDAAGNTFLELEGRDERITLRYRVLDGRLVSMFGPPRARPDSLRLTSDVTLRTRLFTMGFRQLHTDFIVDSTANGRSWTMTGTQEPDWVLPFGTELLLRAPLRRPFQGSGAMFRVEARGGALPGGQSLLIRRTRLDVQESTIMRAINVFVSRLFDDISRDVEREESAFLRGMLAAFRADLAGIQKRHDPAESWRGM